MPPRRHAIFAYFHAAAIALAAILDYSAEFSPSFHYFQLTPFRHAIFRYYLFSPLPLLPCFITLAPPHCQRCLPDDIRHFSMMLSYFIIFDLIAAFFTPPRFISPSMLFITASFMPAACQLLPLFRRWLAYACRQALLRHALAFSAFADY